MAPPDGTEHGVSSDSGVSEALVRCWIQPAGESERSRAILRVRNGAEVSFDVQVLLTKTTGCYVPGITALAGRYGPGESRETNVYRASSESVVEADLIVRHVGGERSEVRWSWAERLDLPRWDVEDPSWVQDSSG